MNTKLKYITIEIKDFSVPDMYCEDPFSELYEYKLARNKRENDITHYCIDKLGQDFIYNTVFPPIKKKHLHSKTDNSFAYISRHYLSKDRQKQILFVQYNQDDDEDAFAVYQETFVE